MLLFMRGGGGGERDGGRSTSCIVCLQPFVHNVNSSSSGLVRFLPCFSLYIDFLLLVLREKIGSLLSQRITRAQAKHTISLIEHYMILGGL